MDNRRKKLLYRACHRGIKEMDLIFSAFCERELSGLNEVELGQFEALLEIPDQDLYAWITGAEAVPEQYRNGLLNRLRASPPMAELATS